MADRDKEVGNSKGTRRKSRSDPNQKRKGDTKKKKDKGDIGYCRVLGIRKDKDGNEVNLKKYETIVSNAGGANGFMHLLSGEKKEVTHYILINKVSYNRNVKCLLPSQDRQIRLKMNSYRQLLLTDLKIAEKACAHHENRHETLQLEFKDQEMQLWRWGLAHVIKDFKMQV